MKITKYIIYWAHLPEHKDPMTEGYIGITKRTLKDRIHNHYSTANYNSKLNKMCKFHEILLNNNNIMFELLSICPNKMSALAAEKCLRNECNISFTWNSMVGGGSYPEVTDETKLKLSKNRLGKKLKDETKLKLSINRLGDKNPFFGKKHSEESKNKISSSRKGKNRKISDELINIIKTSNLGPVALSKIYNLNRKTIYTIRKTP